MEADVTVGGEFEGIGQEIFQYLLQPGVISGDGARRSRASRSTVSVTWLCSAIG